MRSTSYDIENIYHRYNKILEKWKPDLIDQTLEDFIFVKQEHVSEHNVTFTKEHCLRAQHDLGDVETNREPQYVKNGCKYFLYWLYFEVLEKNVDYHKVLKIYEDVVKGSFAARSGLLQEAQVHCAAEVGGLPTRSPCTLFGDVRLAMRRWWVCRAG
ncbi:PIR protein [Plasmodium vivax]|uniref:VIR protein n=1 Tax=Plasmodium vivax TaxID=5855 RepID=A0A565A611_PLAVI|nr:PIR protein [Plasmodium vivax]